jgi:hypothetical protein
VVLKPDGKAYTEVAKVKVAETPTYAHPVVSGDKLFIKEQDALVAYTLQ